MTTTQRPAPDLSVVVPLYNEEGNVGALVAALREAVAGLGVAYEIILVDDGSRDGTWPAIAALSDGDDGVIGVALSRNFGHQNAVFAGLHHARGAAVVTMDGDLQHPPALIPAMVEAWRAGHQIVETRRSESQDVTRFKKESSRLFYRVFSRLSGIPLSAGTSDFRLLDARVVRVILDMKDSELFLRGLTHWVGYRKTTLPYQAASRHSGQTKYSLRKMLKFAASSVVSFSSIPLRIGIWLGVATSGLAFLELVYILWRYLTGQVVAGWASILGVVSFMFGILFVLLGIIGVYLGSIFEMLKNRPRFLVRELIGPHGRD